jgi:hypothetical protein
MYPDKTKHVSFFSNSLPAVIIFILIYLFIYLIQGIPIIDDAYIYYRYAVNWASGYGPVFNIGEYVEGNTNFLWTAILAVGAFFSLEPASFAPILNLFIGIACLFLMNYICSFISFHRPFLIAIVLPIVYLLSYGIYLYGASGMDTLLFSLVLLLCIITLHKGKETGKFFIALPFLFFLNISRPEAPLYAIMMIGILSYFVFLEHKSIPKQLFALIIIYIGLTILLFTIRYIVYNELIPSTVQAKGYATYSIKKFLFEGDFKALKNFLWVIYRGFKYEAPFLYLGVWIPYIILFVNKNKKDYLLWLIASCIAVNAFVSIWAGGDFMPFYRHLISVLPILIIFVGWSIDLLLDKYWGESKHKKIALATVLILMIFLWVSFFLKPAEFTKKYVKNAKSSFNSETPYFSYHFLNLKELGILLRDISVPTTLLTDMAGIIPYYAGIHVYVRDLYGLMDIHNAKYGDIFCTPSEGGICGRTDYNYSFSAPFDIFIYNAININKRFVSFCKENLSICQKYRFFKKEEWYLSRLYIIANINHPVSTILEKKFGTIPIPIDENLLDVIQLK